MGNVTIINENGPICEMNELKNKIIELENASKVKERKIRYLESKLVNKKQKVLPCQNVHTQVICN